VEDSFDLLEAHLMSSNSNVSQMAINTLHSVAQRRAESLPKVIAPRVFQKSLIDIR